MRQIKNTLYVFTEDLFLALDGEMLLQRDREKKSRAYPCTRSSPSIPSHILEQVPL